MTPFVNRHGWRVTPRSMVFFHRSICIPKCRHSIKYIGKCSRPGTPNHNYNSAIPLFHNGRFAIVTDVGRGAVDAYGALNPGVFERAWLTLISH
jgi:hypothetical protein